MQFSEPFRVDGYTPLCEQKETRRLHFWPFLLHSRLLGFHNGAPCMIRHCRSLSKLVVDFGGVGSVSKGPPGGEPCIYDTHEQPAPQ